MSLLKVKITWLILITALSTFGILQKRHTQLNFIDIIAHSDYINAESGPHSMPFLHSVIPRPTQLIVDTLQNLRIQDGIAIYYDSPYLKDLLQEFSQDLGALLNVPVSITNIKSPVFPSQINSAKQHIPMRKMPEFISNLRLPIYQHKELKILTHTIRLAHDKKNILATEAYQIRSIPEAQQIIISGTEQGIFYATRTLLQICYQQLYRLGYGIKLFPKILVQDTPQFIYRGLHLDVARHFFPLPEVKKLIRLMSFYKLNKLHLHLSDDQGWRVELNDFPRLTEVGSIRKRTLIGRDRGHSDKSPRFDQKPYGGFYTTQDLQELSDYARKHAVEIIPEIDMPSHATALIASYPFLACDSTQDYEVRGLWRGGKTPLCLGRERTYEFLFKLLKAISTIFPGKYLHIGQDEVQTVTWEQCPDCQKMIKQLRLKNLDEYRHYFQQRISNFVRQELKRIPIIWDDNFKPKQADPQTTLMVWKKARHIREALKHKIPVIVADNNAFYLNYYQTKHYRKEPMSFMRRASMRNLYSYALPSKVLGAQVLLWTEYIRDFATLQIKLLPRMIAGAENFWTIPERKNYADFLLRLKVHDFYLSREQLKYVYLE